MARATPGPEGHFADAEESYFISMTDLMIGMLFIFIIILMAFSLNYRSAEEGLVGAQDARTRMLSSVERSLMDIGVRAKVFPETGVLRLPEDLLFDSGHAELNSTGEEVLQFIGHVLRTVLPCYAVTPPEIGTGQCDPSPGGRLETVLIEGHTDNVPLASTAHFRDNWELSMSRAITTYKALVGSDNIIPSLTNSRGDRLVGVSGYGEYRPIDTNDTDEGRRNNRRIDLRFLMSTPEVAPGRAVEGALEAGRGGQ